MKGDLQDDPLCVEDSSVAHWLLIDNAQTSYSDEDLWAVFLKLIPGHYRVVMFASYGNQQLLGLEAVDIIGVPIVIPSYLQMGLRPTENGLPDAIHIPGLYFLQEEFTQILARRRDLPVLEPDISTWVFETSSGHIGAIDSILTSIKAVAVRILISDYTFPHTFYRRH
jgi:hypothetical protein